ncbi:MAG: hypothetical protein ACRYGK_16370, partial [Janthinobacterium lividum]
MKPRIATDNDIARNAQSAAGRLADSIVNAGNVPGGAAEAKAGGKRRIPAVVLASLFLLLVCISLVAVDAWRTWSDRNNQLAEADVAMTNIARALAQHADDTLTVADAVLLGLVERVESEGTGPAALERLRKLLAKQTKELAPLHGIFVYDGNGDWLVNSMKPVVPGQYNNADRDYFQYHVTHSGTKSYIGLPIESRTTGEWVIPMSRRITNVDGSFGGVVLATISMDYFRVFYSGFDIGEDGAIVFGRDDGSLMLRRPFNDEQLGQNYSKAPLFVAMKKNRTGSAVLVAPSDGIERLYSYRHLENYP